MSMLTPWIESAAVGVNHCVTVLSVETNRVVVGDPLSGLEFLPREEFLNQWELVGVVLNRTGTSPASSRK